MKTERTSLLLLASYLAACQAEDASKEDDGFMNNEFFQKLYDLLPDIEQQWVVLLIFGGAAVLVLLIALCVLRCLCCRGGSKNIRQEKLAQYSSGASPATSAQSSERDVEAYPASEPYLPTQSGEIRTSYEMRKNSLDKQFSDFQPKQPPVPLAKKPDLFYGDDSVVATSLASQSMDGSNHSGRSA